MFPTGVGMNRGEYLTVSKFFDVPHGRGDEPEDFIRHEVVIKCSPRAWG